MFDIILIHPKVVNFTIALFSSAILFDVIGLMTKNENSNGQHGLISFLRLWPLLKRPTAKWFKILPGQPVTTSLLFHSGQGCFEGGGAAKRTPRKGRCCVTTRAGTVVFRLLRDSDRWRFRAASRNAFSRLA